MRRIVFPILIFLFLSSAYGWIAGETKKVRFTRCSMLEINITGDAGVDFWTFAPACIRLSVTNTSSVWQCFCHDNYDLEITPPPDYIGTATITITQVFQTEKEYVVINATIERPYFLKEYIPKVVNYTLIKYFENTTKIQELQERIENLIREINMGELERERLMKELEALNSLYETLASELEYYKNYIFPKLSEMLKLEREKGFIFSITSAAIGILFILYILLKIYAGRR